MWIRCRDEHATLVHLKHGYVTYINDPVNMNQCSTFNKQDFDGANIVFYINGMEKIWKFKDKITRDKYYDYITTLSVPMKITRG